MRTASIFHLRALITASIHVLFSAALGAAVLFLAVVDVLASPAEGGPPWWLTVMHRFAAILNAPMAGFFGLWDNTRTMRLLLLLLAAAWSLVLGYAVSFVWQRAENIIDAKYRCDPATVQLTLSLHG